MSRLRITVELLDKELIENNPGCEKKTFEVNGMVLFGFDRDGKEETASTEVIGKVNQLAMAQGISMLPFGRRVITMAMMNDIAERFGIGSDKDCDCENCKEEQCNQDKPAPGAPSLKSLLKKLGIDTD
jgi:hypothetical protein